MNKETKKYLKDVENALVGSGKQKAGFLKSVTTGVEGAYAENSNVTYSELCARFGEPSAIAKEMICDADVGEIKKKINIKKVIAISLAVLLAIIAVSYGVVLWQSHKNNNGYAVVKVYEGITSDGGVSEITEE